MKYPEKKVQIYCRRARALVAPILSAHALVSREHATTLQEAAACDGPRATLRSAVHERSVKAQPASDEAPPTVRVGRVFPPPAHRPIAPNVSGPAIPRTDRVWPPTQPENGDAARPTLRSADHDRCADARRRGLHRA
jgi:hypothetical protein